MIESKRKVKWSQNGPKMVSKWSLNFNTYFLNESVSEIFASLIDLVKFGYGGWVVGLSLLLLLPELPQKMMLASKMVKRDSLCSNKSTSKASF